MFKKHGEVLDPCACAHFVARDVRRIEALNLGDVLPEGICIFLV